MIVLGIDPGSRHVGLAITDTDLPGNRPDALIAWATVDRAAIEPGLGERRRWLRHVLDRITDLLEPELLAELIAVEDVTPPTPHLGMTNPAAIIDTALLTGAILGQYPDAITIPPGGHGNPVPDGITGNMARRILLATYPPDLVGARETTGRGKGPRQHARAAYDVARTAARRTPRLEGLS